MTDGGSLVAQASRPAQGQLLCPAACCLLDCAQSQHPHQRWGKNLQAGEKDLSSLESPPWLGPSEPSTAVQDPACWVHRSSDGGWELAPIPQHSRA